jgi:hypothetical protein
LREQGGPGFSRGVIPASVGAPGLWAVLLGIGIGIPIVLMIAIVRIFRSRIWIWVVLLGFLAASLWVYFTALSLEFVKPVLFVVAVLLAAVFVIGGLVRAFSQSLSTDVREFMSMIDGWAAAKMLLSLLVAVGIVIGVIGRLL